jgi:hypothetical protein
VPVELSIVESVTALETTVVEVILESASEPGPAGPGVPTGGTNNQVLTKQSATDYDTAWEDPTGGPGGGVTDADYLVGTAHVDLSAEIVVGTSPGGELGGTWAAPTVDATHSGSSHAGVQAAAEATAAGALTAHEADTTAVHGIANTANLYSVGGTDVAIADGGTGASTAAGARANLDLEAGVDFPSLTTFNDHLADATDAHDASAISVVDTGTFYTATDVEGVLAEIAPQLGGGSGESFQRDISQAAHGLAVGNVVRHNGTIYVKAQANSDDNAEVAGLVSAVADANNFTLHYGGLITGLSGLVAGTVYFLSAATAGLLTATEPNVVGEVSKPLLVADSTTSGYFLNFRGAVIGTGGAEGSSGLVLLSDTTLGSDAASIDITGIPGSYKHLRIIALVRSTRAGQPGDNWRLRFNNDSGANYYTQSVFASGVAEDGAEEIAASGTLGNCPGATATSGFFAPVDATIVDYASTTKAKVVTGTHLSPTGVTTGLLRMQAAGWVWNSTAAINRITVLAANGNLLAGTRLTIYGVA